MLTFNLSIFLYSLLVLKKKVFKLQNNVSLFKLEKYKKQTKQLAIFFSIIKTNYRSKKRHRRNREIIRDETLSLHFTASTLLMK